VLVSSWALAIVPLFKSSCTGEDVARLRADPRLYLSRLTWFRKKWVIGLCAGFLLAPRRFLATRCNPASSP